MMTDGFAAQLRHHLLETANERPAEGALAAIDTAVAVTAQRHPLAARLGWNLARARTFAPTSLRYGLVALALLLALVAAALLASGKLAGKTPFEGQWSTTDREDGSVQFLFIGAGKTPAVRYQDLFAGGAICADDASKVFTADGSGVVASGVLHAVFPNGGGCGLVVMELGPGEYTHDAAADTLTGIGQTWARVTDTAFVAPSLGPPRTPTPLRPVPGCVDLAEGGTYSAGVGSAVLTATVPDKPLTSWQGEPEFFLLSGECRGRPAIAIYPMVVIPAQANSCALDAGEVRSFAEAVEILAAHDATGITGPSDLSIDGHTAVRFDVANLRNCPGGFGLQGGVILGGGESGSIYVIDIDQTVVSIEANWTVGATPAQIAETQAIVESLQINRVVLPTP